jgi:DNA-binding response OmpR family regulator
LNESTETRSFSSGGLTQVVRSGPLEIRIERRTALVDGRTLALTVREFQLLAAMASNPEQVISRDELYRIVWGGQLRAADRSVDVYVSKLRTKLDVALPHWSYIQTHVGFGYCYSPRCLVE